MCLKLNNLFLLQCYGRVKNGFMLSLVTLFLALPVLVVAETRQHRSHEHGIGQLNIVREANNLIIELISPAANIIGFEHEPRNEKQVQTVREATARLDDGARLFILPAKAECTLNEGAVDSELLPGLEKHKEDQAHDEHEATAPGPAETHSEFKAVYHFACGAPDHLNRMKVALFSLFPGVEQLQVQLLTPKGQAAMALTPQQDQVSF